MAITIGTYVRNKRQEKGLTMKQLAKKCRISMMEIWRIETGVRQKTNLEFLTKLAKVLEFRLLDMLVEVGIVPTVTEEEKSLITDPHFEKIFYELDKRKDLKDEEKDQLAKLLMRIIKSYSSEEE